MGIGEGRGGGRGGVRVLARAVIVDIIIKTYYSLGRKNYSK